MTESKQGRFRWLPEWQKKIIRKYPLLYLETPPDRLADLAQGSEPTPYNDDRCSLRYGFECELGWAGLLDELSSTGTALVQALRAFNFQDNAEIRAFIVKEKFGVLVWAGHDNLLPPFHKLWSGYVAWIRQRSTVTCERSGAFGQLRDLGGRVITLSDAEYQKELIQRAKKRR